MDVRNERKQVEGVLLGVCLRDLRFVGRLISENAEDAFQKVAKSALLGLPLSVINRLRARRGSFPPNAESASEEPSDKRPVIERILSATLLVASRMAWKKFS